MIKPTQKLKIFLALRECELLNCKMRFNNLLKLRRFELSRIFLEKFRAIRQTKVRLVLNAVILLKGCRQAFKAKLQGDLHSK